MRTNNTDVFVSLTFILTVFVLTVHLPFFLVYVWILSRNPVLNDVSKERAMTSLAPLGIKSSMLIRDDGKCVPKYWENRKVEPVVFRTPVPIQKKF